MSDPTRLQPGQRAFFALQDPLSVEVVRLGDDGCTIRFLESGYDAAGLYVPEGSERRVNPLELIEDEMNEPPNA